MSVAMGGDGSEPAFGQPELLFEGRYFSQPFVINFDAWPDGRRFVMVENKEGTRARRIQIVQNWFHELETAAR